MDDKKVAQKLKEGELVQVQVESTSDLWEKFCLLHEKDTRRYIEYAICLKCDKIFKHNRTTSGTTNLKKHASLCEKVVPNIQIKQDKVTNFFVAKIEIPKPAQLKVANACIEFVARDLRSLKAVEGNGLISLVQAAIQVGAKHGNVPAKQLLPSRNTVKRKLISKAVEVKESLSHMMMTAMEENGLLGITTDMWTDVKQRHYISLTAHFICDGKLQARVINVQQFTDDRKTGANIKASISNSFLKLGIPLEKIAQNCYFVTDQGSNFKLALSSFHRQPCACHVIATVIRHTLQLNSYSTIQDDPEDRTDFAMMIGRTVSSVKALAGYVKRSGLNNKLSTSLKQSNDTRWNSVLVLLQSFMNIHKELQNRLALEGQKQRLADIDFAVVTTLIEFLKPFYDATKALESDKHATIHQVFQWNVKLQRFLYVKPSDSSLMCYLKQSGLDALGRKFEVTLLHKVGLFLNPKFKSLRAMNFHEQQEVKTYLNSFLSLIVTENNPGSSHVHASEHSYAPKPEKARKTVDIDDEFGEWLEGPDCPSEKNEIEEYASFTFADEVTNAFFTDGQFDIIKFWSSANLKSQFPKLSRLACGVLSIPASSASSERVFTTCGQAVLNRRAQLSSSTLDSLLVLNSMWQH